MKQILNVSGSSDLFFKEFQALTIKLSKLTNVTELMGNSFKVVIGGFCVHLTGIMSFNAYCATGNFIHPGVFVSEDIPEVWSDRRKVLKPIFNAAHRVEKLKAGTRFVHDKLQIDGRTYSVDNIIHKPTEVVVNTFLESGYLSYITKPTRVTHSSSTLIDNMYVCSGKMMANESYVITDGMSDHFPCVLSYCLFQRREKQSPVIIEKRKLSDEALFKVQHKLLHLDWSFLYNCDLSVDDSYNFLSNTISSVIEEFAPIKKVKIMPDQRFHEPWLTVSISKCNRKSRKLCSKAKQSGLHEDHLKYKRYRNVLNRIKQQEKRSFYNDLFKKIGKNSKLLWEVVNNLIRKVHNKQGIVEILSNDKSLTKQDEISEAFNLHFATAGKKVYESIPPVSGENCTKLVKPVKNRLKFKTVSESYVIRLVDKISPKTSKGPDGLSNLLLKQLISVIKCPLMVVINKSLSTGVFPDLLKIARVIPLFKSGECNVLDNYHPISLLPVISKIVE